MTTPPPRRRRFRFSLRTFFVLVAVLAVPTAWMAREAAIVRERQALLASLEKRSLVFLPAGRHDYDQHTLDLIYSFVFDYDRSPWLRRWLGDCGFVSRITCPIDADRQDLERIKSTFPEATIEPWSEWRR